MKTEEEIKEIRKRHREAQKIGYVYCTRWYAEEGSR